jgi:FixJ family two-component response regulator
MSGRLKAGIAIVDDDALVREGLKDCVESGGYSVEDFGSAEEFLGSGSAKQAVCLILDVQLPGITGLELQSRLRASGNHTPIVFVTAHGTEANREQALRNGAVALLSKPVRREELLKVVKAAIQP